MTDRPTITDTDDHASASGFAQDYAALPNTAAQLMLCHGLHPATVAALIEQRNAAVAALKKIRGDCLRRAQADHWSAKQANYDLRAIDAALTLCGEEVAQ